MRGDAGRGSGPASLAERREVEAGLLDFHRLTMPGSGPGFQGVRGHHAARPLLPRVRLLDRGETEGYTEGTGRSPGPRGREGWTSGSVRRHGPADVILSGPVGEGRNDPAGGVDPRAVANQQLRKSLEGRHRQRTWWFRGCHRFPMPSPGVAPRRHRFHCPGAGQARSSSLQNSSHPPQPRRQVLQPPRHVLRLTAKPSRKWRGASKNAPRHDRGLASPQPVVERLGVRLPSGGGGRRSSSARGTTQSSHSSCAARKARTWAMLGSRIDAAPRGEAGELPEGGGGQCVARHRVHGLHGVPGEPSRRATSGAQRIQPQRSPERP